jgi:hypothetical protein
LLSPSGGSRKSRRPVNSTFVNVIPLGKGDVFQIVTPCPSLVLNGPGPSAPLGYTMNDRLRKFMEALSLLAKQSDEPEAQLSRCVTC